MTELFSEEWMQQYLTLWNGEPVLAKGLARLGFSGVLGFGLIGDHSPRGVISVIQGKAVSAGAYQDEGLDWDIRCSQEQWRQWLDAPPGLLGLGVAYTSGSLKFNKGHYSTLFKDPQMAAPLIKSIAVMAEV